jgi:hypothetical protein
MTIKQLLAKLPFFSAKRDAVDPRRTVLMERARIELDEETIRASGEPRGIAWLEPKLKQCAEELGKLSDPTLDAMVAALDMSYYKVTEFVCTPYVSGDDDIRNRTIFFRQVVVDSLTGYDRNSGIVYHLIDRLVTDGVVNSRLLTKDEEVIVGAVLKVFLRFHSVGDGNLSASVVAVMSERPELADDLIAYIEHNHVSSASTYVAMQDVDAHRFLIEHNAPAASLAEGML